MKTILLCFFLTLTALAGGSEQLRLLSSEKYNGHIEIDGKLNEPVWADLIEVEFTQRDPDEGKPSTQRTALKILHTDNAIIFGIRCYDTNPDSIIAHLARRDYWVTSDRFLIFLDPYNDKRSGYYFAVNAGGAMGDGTLFNDDWDDDSWNGVWTSGVNIDEKGWTVEVKIPFSQLRFSKNESMKWGVNFKRVIARNNEESYLRMVPKKESGFVSKFLELKGLDDISPVKNLEVLPYFVQKAQYLIHDAGDPFYKSNQYVTSFGGDLKYGITSNITLDLTVNPDFGQVEVDPAVLNLSAFETFFNEKRPFFIEGSNLLFFGFGGSNNNWGFNFGNPDIFYSRRIGKSPSAPVSDADYVKYPEETRILGAAKLTGKISDGWSVYALNAVTDKMSARLWNSGNTSFEEVEPLTNYTVIRSQKEFDSSRYAIGFVGTSTFRNIQRDEVKNYLGASSLVGGLDGWVFLDKGKKYVITYWGTYSKVNGTKEYITRLQQKPIHYLQRPDASYMRLDTNLTSLTGWGGRIAFNKQEGDFYVNAALGAISPGMDVNDLGFQWRADVINGHIVTGYRWNDPDGTFRRKQVYLAHFRTYDFEGDLDMSGIFTTSNFTFNNYWNFNMQLAHHFNGYDGRLTRGGPKVVRPDGGFTAINVRTDSRKEMVFGVFTNYEWNDDGATYNYIEAGIEWKPTSTISLEISPGFEYNNNKKQWIDSFDDPSAMATYGKRYVFGELDQKTVFSTIRLNWTFNPYLTLQLFAQPFISVGKYSYFKELSAPRTDDYHVYGKGASAISYDEGNSEYQVKTQEGTQFNFGNPDFNFKSLRLNMILRWEYTPGASVYLVWSHNQMNFDDPGRMEMGRDFKNLFSAEGDDIFMVKATYWFNALDL
ncbi:MAG: carbohydrate binding family 9 domain-containing protein [Ignavibacteriaceae bacterium]|nr:carbohydrate binding family 9 domain-containing protein [Ignavibacteriaceae bacterium]